MHLSVAQWIGVLRSGHRTTETAMHCDARPRDRLQVGALREALQLPPDVVGRRPVELLPAQYRAPPTGPRVLRTLVSVFESEKHSLRLK